MSIAMVSEHASPLAALGGVDAGGQNVHVANVADHLSRRGVQVTVHTRRDDPQLPPRVPFGRGALVEHVDAGPPRPVPKDRLFRYMDRFAHQLATAWRRSPPELVHAHFWMSGYAALRAARPFGIPVVQTFHALGVVKRRHQGRLDTSPPERLEVETQLIAEADHIIATCTDEVFELKRLGGVTDRISIVPCGVDLLRFTPRGSRDARRGAMHRLVVVSRLVPRKGIDDIIVALADVPDAELIIAGGPAPERLEEDDEIARLVGVARAAGVLDRVRFRGRVPREAVPPLLRSADVVLTTPWYEPFGIVPLEAMACGVPVIASAVGGMVDTVVDGATGVHVPPRDPEAIAAAARRLLADPQLRRELGRAGRERAESRYDWNRVADATLDVYRRLLSAPSAEPAEEVVR